MGKQAFDKKIEAIEALRSEADPRRKVEQLRKALGDRNNYLVSKAAAIAAQSGLEELLPDFLAAFERFLIDPVKSDPQCWAKNAIVKALKDLGHRGAQVYLKGIDHVQLEPVYGGRADSAATLRGACALALVDCPIDDVEILTHLADRLADAEKTVRIDAATAIAQLGRREGTPLLRLKALAGDSEPDVTGQCFVALLSLVPAESVAFVGRFLESHDPDVQLEAAAALAQAREPEAIELVKRFWRERLPVQLRQAVIQSLVASPLREAADFLLSIIPGATRDVAESAIAALAASRFRDEMRERTSAAVADKDDPELARIFEREFRSNAERRG